ncbi:MAG: aminotransferase class V-fold PLP-dependent enzyme [Deltaproteobacteria bacterium]|nr:aminotransferase class V-fold PLP-dependent enzyme [Deltaproteobacteria bacterium]
MKSIYLDNGATSFPKPDCVTEAVVEVLTKKGGNPGRGSHRLSLEASRVVFNARESLAKLLNISDSSRIAFTKNATEAINIALKGLLKEGDHVITSAFEHNSVAKTLFRLEEQGVDITKIKGSERADLITVKDVEAAITDKTKLVTIVHASNVFGTIQPIAEIAKFCRSKNIIFMTDAAQTVGAVPVDIKELDPDILVGTGHKSLFGPQGTGFIYLRRGIEPWPLVDGGTGELEDVLEVPERLESGTMNTPGIGGLGAGVDFVITEGIEKIRTREVALLKRLICGVQGIEGTTILGSTKAEERVSILCFTLKGITPTEVGLILDRDYSIMIRCGTHCAPEAHATANTHPLGAIRVCPGYFTTEGEVDLFLKAIREIA